jgi:hypothetical protein
MAPSLRAQRLRLAWVLALPFFLFARPTLLSLAAGGLVSLPGLVLRGVASGFIFKDRSLARHGPFGHLRHPLYVGSFFAGLGLALASGRWVVVGLFLVLFPWVYLRTIRAEEAELELRFGEAYRIYREQVPAFIPRLVRRPKPEGIGISLPSPSGASDPGSTAPGEIRSFHPDLFRRNRGWEATLGVLAGLVLLWLRMRYRV